MIKAFSEVFRMNWIICGQGIFALVSSVKPVDKGDQHRKVWEQRPALSVFSYEFGIAEAEKN
jgi:hypothetical protein